MENENKHVTQQHPPFAQQQGRVLSIQSHVVYGYVGNKAAVFPLQLLNFDVDFINSVHFSNHTGHPHGSEGTILSGQELQAIVTGLQRNGLLTNVRHLLTGYIGSESCLRAICQVLHALPSDVRYVCDPVLGDEGKFYVPQELVKIYKEEILPLAHVVTPNLFEVEQLTSVKVRCLKSAKTACRTLHELGPDLVFISGIVSNGIGNSDEDFNRKTMTSIASNRFSNPTTKNIEYEMWRIDSPVISGSFTGAGDLCAALLLGWTARYPNNLQLVLETVVSTMYSVIQRTVDATNDGGPVMKHLQLVQSKSVIENPPLLFKAKRVLCD